MRKLDDIIPPSRRRDMEPLNNPPSDREPYRPSERPSGGRPSRIPYGTLIAAVVVIIASVLALVYFSTAKVQVTPSTVSAAVSSSFTASQSGGTLSYQIVTAQKIASQSVKSTGSKTVTSSASGTVTVYNTQSKAQRLIENTRFATTAGLIFRIHTAITIPAGTTAKPGSVTAKIYADKPGEAYNVAPTSFTVPGLAGTPQASEVYAQSSAAITGGASGSVPVVEAGLEAQTANALIAALGPDLATSLNAKIPAGYVLLPGAATTTYQELSSAPSSTTGMADIKEQGTVTAIVFPNAALAKSIAASVGGLGYQGEPVTLASVTGLALKFTGAMPDSNATSVTFMVSGTAPLVYTVDSARIAAAVSGKTRSAAEVALTNYPEVKSAIITLRPFWRQTFPQDPASISVIVANP